MKNKICMKRIYFLVSAALTAASVLFTGCQKNQSVRQEVFGNHEGKNVYLLTLTNKNGNVIRLTNYGAKINWIEVPDKKGTKANITFGYDTFEETLAGDMSFGSTVGRYANRIANGKFTLDGVEYTLPQNNGPNTLHGGPLGWHSVVWDTEILGDSEYPAVKFTYHSPDMEMGFPGNVDAEIIYTWTDDNEIVMDYKATTDKKTVINLTNHAYFNLHGNADYFITDHILTIRASAFTPVDSFMIPTGEIRSVEGTPFDFRKPLTIERRIGDVDEQLIIGKGYDHNYVLDNSEEVDAIVFEPISGRVLEVITDQPGLQLYVGNFLDGSQKGHGGVVYNFRCGFCLESGHFPDSPNHPEFPSTVLNPGETYKTRTVYRFSIL